MFTANHFIWIAICVVMIGVLLFFSLKFKFSLKVASLIMSGIAVASELCKIFTHINVTNKGGVLDAEALPLHLCSLLIFVIFYITFARNTARVERMKSFLVPIGILGGFLAIMMATSGVDFAKPYAYQCFIYHAGLMWYAIYLICSQQVNLGWRDYLRNLSYLAGLVFIMLWVNSALQTYKVNFFYIVRPPVSGLPLLNLNNGWFVYFITVVLLGVLGVTLVHLPTMIIEAVKKTKHKKATKDI